MRLVCRLVIVALAATTLLVVAAPATTAQKATVPDGVVGVYTWHDSGYRAIEGYSPCGHDFGTWYDSNAKFYVAVRKGGYASASGWAHSVDDGDFQRVLSAISPLTFTPEALAVIHEDMQRYFCTA